MPEEQVHISRLNKQFGATQRSLRKLKDTVFTLLHKQNVPYENNG